LSELETTSILDLLAGLKTENELNVAANSNTLHFLSFNRSPVRQLQAVHNKTKPLYVPPWATPKSERDT